MLNQSRLKALEELQGARETIADLKSQLLEANEELNILRANGDQLAAIDELRSQLRQANEELELLKLADDQLTTIEDLRSQLEQANAELQDLKSSRDQASASATDFVPPVPSPAMPAGAASQPPAAVSAPPAGEPPGEAVSTQYITLYYRTGWRKAFIHCSVDGKGWTQTPGLKMTDDGECKKMVFKGSRMEFVVNNGGDNWDKLDPYSESGPKNYSITSPGALPEATVSLACVWGGWVCACVSDQGARRGGPVRRCFPSRHAQANYSTSHMLAGTYYLASGQLKKTA